jgi:hypothetical protein
MQQRDPPHMAVFTIDTDPGGGFHFNPRTLLSFNPLLPASYSRNSRGSLLARKLLCIPIKGS